MLKKDLFQAFALGFPDGYEGPPAVVARGEFDMAAFMVSVARKHGIPVVEKPEMCSMLEDVEVGQTIPERLFEAAAALLVELGILGTSLDS
jgi:type III secretion system FlhB-like substrate exporter